MKYTSKQMANSRNNALLRRAARLGCGISLVAMSAMLTARPVKAQDAAEVLSNSTPADSSSAGFVTSGSDQTNTATAISALVNDVVGTSSVTNTTGLGSLPSTATVTGNKLAAYATGSGQTNTVDLANIGTGEDATGIAVLADQLNQYLYAYDNNIDDYVYTPETINAAVVNSALSNDTTNAISGDSLTNSNNLITAQVTGNVADSSVNGVVPVEYDTPEAGAAIAQPGSGAGSGNVVVASSQTNIALAGSIGSFSTLSSDSVSIGVDSSGEAPQDLSLTITDGNNALTSEYLGNSAINDIGVALTSGTVTGAPSLAGSLVVLNQQASMIGGYGGGTVTGVGAYTADVFTGVNIGGGNDGPVITLTDGAITVANNVISSSATQNDAVGAAGAPGNEISLGINLTGATTGEGWINTISAGNDLQTGADLALSNQQYADGTTLASSAKYFNIDAYVQNLAGSSVGVSNNAVSASALSNDASNAIITPSDAGINLISGLAGLTSQQNGEGTSHALVQYGGIGIYAGDGNTLSLTNSSLTMSNDQITANAGVNLVTNAISLSANTIDAGPLGAEVPAPFIAGTIGGTEIASAGLSLNNQQNSTGGGYAFADESAVDIGAYVSGTTLSNDSAVLTNPAISAVATANSATNSVSANASQVISGSIDLLNTQYQNAAGAEASLATSDDDTGGVITIAEESYAPEGISGNTALLSGSSFSANATDNYASNTLDATGGSLTNAVEGTFGIAAQLSNDSAAAQAISDLALGNIQDDINAPAYALNYYQQALIDANAAGGTVSGSSFVISGPASNAPASQALAIGNEALNVLSAAATTVMQDSAALVNAQNNSTGATASLEYGAIWASINGYANSDPNEDGNDGGNVSNTSVIVGTGATGGSNPNVMRALAYDNQATNALSVSAELLAPGATGFGDYAVDGSVIDGNDSPFDSAVTIGSAYAIGAAYGLLNDQASDGDVTSGVLDSTIGAYIGNDATNPAVTDVTESTNGNAIVASVFANQATNTGSVAAGNLSVGSYTPLADVTNLQSSSADLSGSFTEESGYDAFTSQVNGDGAVTGSAISVNNNTALTQVEANQAANSLDTTGGSIVDTSSTALPSLSGNTFDEGTDAASAAFTVQNVQYDESAVTASQGSTDALVSIGGSVSSSTLMADGNAFQATGYENNATNGLSFGGTGNTVNLLDTSSGLQNVQYADGSDTVELGTQGTLAVPAGPDTVIPQITYTVANGTSYGQLLNGGATLVVSGEPLVFHLSSLSGTELSDFENLFSGGSSSYDSSTHDFTLTAGTYSVSDTSLFTPGGGGYIYNEVGSAETGQLTNSDTIPGTPAVPAVLPSPNILINVAGNITGSTLDVSNNNLDATALANNAVNTQIITANIVNGGSGNTVASAIVYDTGYQATATADYALNNLQSNDSAVSATGYGEVGINPDNTSAISDSTLTVSNNTDVTKAEADVASNTLSLAATSTEGTPPTMALASYQYNDANVTASNGDFGDEPGLVFTAPGAISNSTLTMDNNSSEALAASNDVTNMVSASATTLDTADTSTDDAMVTKPAQDIAGGDYVLTSSQLTQGGTVSSGDLTDITNSDLAANTTGLVSSAVDMSGNSTSAFAEANTATNTVDMTATNSTAKGALLNQQDSSANVSAFSGSYVGFGLTGTAGDPGSPAAADSAINISHNTVQAQGIGNQATNALNANTGATYGGQDEGTANFLTGSATYAVLNIQTNEGPVSSSAGAFIGTGLSEGSDAPPVLNSTVTVSYNVVDAKAFGNSANNSMTVSTLNAGNATASLQNTQFNSAAISASVNGTEIGSNVGAPGVSNVGVAVGNNSIVASAIGNVATNSIAH